MAPTRRVYVSYSSREDASTVDELFSALTRAGYQPITFSAQSSPDVGSWLRMALRDVAGVVVLVGRASLASRTLALEVAALLAYREEQRIPAIPLLHDLTPAEVRAGGMSALAELNMSTARSFTRRITETIAMLDATGAAHPFAEPPVELSTMSVIDVGVPILSLALGEVADRPVVVAGGRDGTVRMWDLGRLGDPTVLRGHAGTALSVAVGTLGETEVVVAGGEDGMVHLWDAATGEPRPAISIGTQVTAVAIERFGEHEAVLAGSGEGISIVAATGKAHREGAVETAVNGIALDGFGVVCAACSDGAIRIWRENDDAVVLGRHPGVARTVATRGGAVFSGGSDGTVRRWDVQSRQETHHLDTGAEVYSVAAGVVDGESVVAVGGNSNLVQLWDPHENTATTLAGHSGSVRAVAIGELGGRSIVVSGSLDGTVRVWGSPVADHVDWLSDAPSRQDLLHRRPLARAIAARLARMNDEEPGTSFLVHLDGPWGTGKSTLLNFLDAELKGDFVTVEFDAWREAGVGPAWWALLTALRDAVRRQGRWPARLWLRVTEAVARLRRVGAPFFLALAVLLVVAGGVFWFFTLKGLQAVAGILGPVGILWAGTLVASRFLLWDSARGARLFEQHDTNPMLEVTRHFGWLLRKSRKPVVFLVDDLDRCQDGYVVELLDSVQTLVRDSGPPSAHFVVSADGAWIRTSYELHYATFAGAVAAPGQPLGYLFLDKFFQLRIPVPAVDATRQRQYLRELLRGPVPPAPATLVREESRVRRQLDRSVTEAQVVETLRGASDEVRDRVADAALDRLTTPAAVAATEHSLQRFAVLLPANPRTMKRFVNTYSAMRAVRTLEGNPVRMETLALWTIIEIRWPGLADHLRARPQDIELVGQEVPEVPESLRPVFADPALRLLVGFDPVAPLDADLVRACCSSTGSRPTP